MSKSINTKVSVTVSELPQLIQTAALAGRSLMIHGSPGLGKSFATHEAAKQMAHGKRVVQLGECTNPDEQFGLFDVRLSQCDPVDVGGLPYADKELGVQRRLVSDWFPSTERTDIPDHGMLLLEEVVSAPPAVQAAAYQLTLDRRIGDKRMKDGWCVVLTGNLMTDGGVVHKMPTPLANRLIHVYVRSDNDSWTQWAIDNDIEPVLIGFIRFRPELLNTFEQHVEKKSKDHAFATERAWHAVNDLLKADPGAHPALLAGTVGNGPATEFAAFRDIWQKMPSIDGILMSPGSTAVPEDTAVRYAVCTALGSRVTGDNFDLIVEYVERMPAEFTMMTIKDCINRKGGEISCTKAFVQVTTKYADYLK